MIAAGAVDKVVTAWMAIGLPWGLSRVLRDYVESGKVALEEWSHLGLGLRFRAAAMGVPFLPTLTMLGSDLMGVGGSKTISCPVHRRDAATRPRPLPRRGAAARAVAPIASATARSTATRTWTPTWPAPPPP